MAEGRPIPIRFPIGDEKSIRIYALEGDKTFSAAVRELCRFAIATKKAQAQPTQPPSNPPAPTRRVLSRGVLP